MYRKVFLKYLRKAFQLLPSLKNPCILDIGCGSGVPTLELATLSEGEIIGIDIDPFFLDIFKHRIEERNLSSRVKARNCSLFEIDYPDESFDLLWAEGSIAIIGFKKGLK